MIKTKKIGGRPALLRQHNLLSVTRRMRELDHFSKIDLARELDISSTTMGKLFQQLETRKLIEPCPVLENNMGRPKRHFQLSPLPRVAAVVIGVQRTTVCIASLSGELHPQRQRHFSTGKNKEDLFKQIQTTLRALEKEQGVPVEIFGICIPGLIDSAEGKSILNPNLPFLEGSRPGEWFEKKLKIPTLLLHEEYALNRAQISAVDPSDSVISLDFSSGVGMCVIDQGKVVTGVSGFAGEIGHVVMNPGGKKCGCGNRGCLETMASDRVFQKSCGDRISKALEKLQQGNQETLEKARSVLQAQAMGTAAVINLFNPGRIFVHSQLAEAYPDYLETLRRETRKSAILPSYAQCIIEISREGKLQGTLNCSIDQFLSRRIDDMTQS